MTNKLFFELNDEKKQRIINAALVEFHQHGFSQSSTNRIVKNAQISKGSLFKYFSSKEELYFFILDMVIENYIIYFHKNISELPNDIYDRTILIAQLEFSWYANHPEYYSLFKKAFSQDQPMYTKCMERYGEKANAVFYKMFEDMPEMNNTEQKKLEILKWVLEGFNKDFINKIKDIKKIDELEKMYMDELKKYMEILKISA